MSNIIQLLASLLVMRYRENRTLIAAQHQGTNGMAISKGRSCFISHIEETTPEFLQ